MNTLALFFVVSLMSTATPGPAVLYVSSHGVSGGLRSAIASSLGILAADGVYILLSITGLTTILVTSYELFNIIRWIGAVYLVYLGVRYIRAGLVRTAPAARNDRAPAVSGRAFLGGFALHAANPKALLYFGSLVPQFVSPHQPVIPQLGALTVIHLLTASSVLLAYSAVSARFRRVAVGGAARRIFNTATGTVMLGAGLGLVFARRVGR